MFFDLQTPIFWEQQKQLLFFRRRSIFQILFENYKKIQFFIKYELLKLFNCTEKDIVCKLNLGLRIL